MKLLIDKALEIERSNEVIQTALDEIYEKLTVRPIQRRFRQWFSSLHYEDDIRIYNGLRCYRKYCECCYQ